VCAAIPVIKVLREALVVTRVHRVLGIVNGTTNFILTEMEGGATFAEALAEAQGLGYAEADPTDDVSGADAAAKMAILATVAFGSRVTLGDVDYQGVDGVTPLHVAAARELDMVIRLVGSATLDDERVVLRPLHQLRHSSIEWSSIVGTEQLTGGDRLIVYHQTPRGMRFVALNLNLVKGRRDFLHLLDERLRGMDFVERMVERSRYLSRPA
jgi:hypothetical protein